MLRPSRGNLSPMNTPSPQKKGFGCLPYGCFIAVCLIVLVGAGLCYLVVSNIRGAVIEYTTEAPVTVPATSMSAPAAQSLQGKLAEFLRISRDKGASGELTLSTDEIAALLMVTPFNGKVVTTLSNDSFSTQFSFRMRELGEWRTGQWLIGQYLDRYVNGSASGTIALSSGQTQITLRSLVLNNKPLEDAALKGASKWVSGAIDAALQTMGQDDSSGVFLSRIDRVWIQDGLFHLKVGPYQGQK
jgi:hypothetical protein